MELHRKKRHDIDLVVDRIVVREGDFLSESSVDRILKASDLIIASAGDRGRLPRGRSRPKYPL